MKTLMNGNTKKSEIIRLTILITISIVPIALIIKGIIRLIGGELITFPFIILFFLSPILIIIGSLYLIRNNTISTGVKTFLCIIMIIVLSVFTFFVIMFGTIKELKTFKNVQAEDKYNNTTFNACSYMPTLADIGNYSDINYYEFQSHNIICSPISNTLITKYDEEEYEIKKQDLILKYVFQTEPINKAEASAIIGDYEFKMLSPDEHCDYYPKHIRFVATNDKTNEIVHINFYNVELDYIDSMENFLLTECGFKYIR